MHETPAIQPTPDEPCAPLPSTSIAAPAQFVELATESRLIKSLRNAAQQRKASEILTRAAVAHYQFLPLPGGESLGNALADLAVTGRAAYALFQRTPVSEAALGTAARAWLAESEHVQATPADVAVAVNATLNRAYAVAWALRGPASQREARRKSLGWIAVSGEDDTPHRPVNVEAPSLRLGDGRTITFEQYEIPVTVRGVTAQTRFFIASAVEDAVPVAKPPFPRTLPPDPVPHIPDGHRVILFLHGHSSSAEEALPLIPEIFKAGRARGTKFSVVSFDLPNSGYSQTFDHEDVALSVATTYPGGIFDGQQIKTPILDFEEDFVIAFVNALNLITPIKNRFAGVIGGSLGGNLGLRLGRRNLTVNPWLSAGIVSWSPASVWDPYVRNEILRMGPDRARVHWEEAETDASRTAYFSEVFDTQLAGLVFPHTQPELWYRNDWTPCKQMQVDEARIARREIYSPFFRQWHWRLGGEQLIYSHIDREDHFDNRTPFRWERNRVRQLLVAGADDNWPGTRIFDQTRKLANWMVHTPGESLFLSRTGHSMHIERPAFLAGKIVNFLAPSTVELQADWRWCNRCQGLFFGPNLANSRCPADGTHAPPQQSGSGNYSLPHSVPSDMHRQADWRWCNKCQGLFYGPNLANSRCPAGGTHASPQESGSGNYSLPHNVPSDPHRQADWRWCNKCQGLFFGRGLAASRCPAGGTHAPPQQSGSGNYSLPHA